MPTTKETMDAIAALEQEYGVTRFVAHEGTHHIRFTGNTGIVENAELPRLRLEMEIVCGENARKKMNIFQGYFAATTSRSTKSIDERRTLAKSILARQLGDIAGSLEDSSDLIAAWRSLPRDNQEGDPVAVGEVENAMVEIGMALEDENAYVRVTVKNGEPRFTFLPTGAADTGCPCVVGDVELPF